MDQKTVEKIAKLARLKVTPEEVVEYSKHFSLILEHFKEIAEVNTDGIAPLVTPSPVQFHARKDENKKTTSTEEILTNAPEKSGNLFKVPPVVGG